MSPSYENSLQNIEAGNRGGKLAELVRSDETDDDNWALEWTTETGAFGFASREVVGEKVVTCGRVSRDEAGHACVVRICEGLAAK